MDEDTLARAFADADAAEAPLNRRLEGYTIRHRALSPEVAAANAALVARLEAVDIGDQVPKPGEAMPSFVLPDQDGRLVSLAELLENRPLVLSLNRGHWCSYCRLELRTLARRHAEIAALGAGVVAMTPDRRALTRKLRERDHLPFPVLSDVDNGCALSLGLMIWIGADFKKLYNARGLNLHDYQGNSGVFLPVPATFIIDRGGRVLARHIDPDFRRRMEMDDILHALVRAQA